MVTGILDRAEKGVRVKATLIEPLPDRPPIGHMDISLNAEHLSADILTRTKHILQTHHGSCPVALHLCIPRHAVATITLPQAFHVQPTEHCVADIETLIGEGAVQLQEVLSQDPAS